MALMAKRRPKKRVAKSTARNPWPGRLAAFRERHDLTQQEAAALASVTSRAWQKWENGDGVPSPAYARLLGLLIADQDRKKI